MSERDRAALVLASGGITGLAFEVGALRALDQVLIGRTVNDFDIYVGTSAGAIVATYVAAGVASLDLTQALAGTLQGFPRLTRMRIYRPNLIEVARRFGDSAATLGS